MPSTPRKTKSQKERETLAEFAALLRALPDPRRKQGQRYPLFTVVAIALMGTVCGCDDAEALGAWGEANEKWLARFLSMPHGAPTQDVYLAVFASIDPRAFNAAFAMWVELLRLRLASKGRHVAIDGKTSRRSFDAASGQPSVHTVSAWLTEESLVLGQVKTADKSNEICAIPELLDLVDISGATVTIDAIGCQTDIARKIVDRGGNYLLAVKGNQPTLHEDVVDTFADALDDSRRPIDAAPRPALETHRDTTKGHGRVEERTTHVCRDLSRLRSAKDWPRLAFLVMAVTERTVVATGKTSREVRYFIGSETAAAAASVAHFIRRHWGIENELHWVLDMAFREDEARHRAGNCAANFATLRHCALNLVKVTKGRRLGVANTRKIAGWNRDVLVSILTGKEI